MNVPQLRFKEFSGEWKETHLIKLAEGENLTNGVFNDPSKVGQGYKLINVLDMYIEGSINEYNLSLVDLDLKEFERNKVKNGDIFFTRSSLVKEGIAHSNVYLGYSEDVTFDGHLVRCSPNKELVTPIFFNFLLKTAKARKQLVARGKTATMTTIGQTDIAQILVDTPLIPEQTKIANFLTTIDERLNQLTHKKELMTQYKQGVMQQIFSQQLRFKDDNGEDFGDWEKKELRDILTIGNGKDYKHLGFGDIPVFGTGGLMTTVNDFLYDGETVCIGRKGNIDKPMYFNGKFWTVDTLFYTHSFKSVLPRFVLTLFQLINWKEYNEATGVPSLSKSTIQKITVNVPSIPEQTKIANFLTAIDEKIQHITQQIEATKQYKRGLLQQMFV